MRTDPRKACDTPRESWFWAIVHDVFAHALMGLTFYSRPAIRFHDWTSIRAWSRPAKGANPIRTPEYVWGAMVERIDTGERGSMMVYYVSKGVWKITHPFVNHAFTTNAASSDVAFIKAWDWFLELSKEFGGDFRLGNGGWKNGI